MTSPSMAPITFKAAEEKFKTYLKNEGRSISTILAYTKDVNQLTNYLDKQKGKTLADQAVAGDIADFKEIMLGQGYTRKSVSRKINSIKSFFRFLLANNYLTENPAEKIAHPKYKIKPPRVFTKQEYEALRSVASSDTRMSAIVEILLQTGMRIGELARLKLEDIDLENKQINITAYESHAARLIEITDSIVETFRKYLAVRPKTAKNQAVVFVTKTGNPFLIRNIRASIDRLFKAAEIKNAKVNDLRHTFIAVQLRGGVPLQEVQAYVGHKRITTTEKYMSFVKRKPTRTAKLIEL